MMASKIMAKKGLILMGVLVVAVFAVTNTALFVRLLPFLLFLACPLMHFLMPGMHGGHGGHSEHGSHDQAAEPQAQQLLPTHEGHAHHVAPAAGAQRKTSTQTHGGVQ